MLRALVGWKARRCYSRRERWGRRRPMSHFVSGKIGSELANHSSSLLSNGRGKANRLHLWNKVRLPPKLRAFKRLCIIAAVIPVPEFVCSLDVNPSNSSPFPTLAINLKYNVGQTGVSIPVEPRWVRNSHFHSPRGQRGSKLTTESHVFEPSKLTNASALS